MRLSAVIILLIASNSVSASTLINEQFKADHVVVIKSQKLLKLLNQNITIATFHVALGPKPTGPKLMQGDERTPEGRYLLDFKNEDSRFYKSIRISYPNETDIQRAAAKGVDPGGSIMIHGLPDNPPFPVDVIQSFNWTDGCVAVTNKEMDIIWKLVEPGTPIDILP